MPRPEKEQGTVSSPPPFSLRFIPHVDFLHFPSCAGSRSPAQSPPLDRWTNEGFLPRTDIDGKPFSCSMEEYRERHRTSPTVGIVQRSSRKTTDLKCKTNLHLQRRPVNQGLAISRTVHAANHKSAISPITENESMEKFRGIQGRPLNRLAPYFPFSPTREVAPPVEEIRIRGRR